jgi:hypothetical protein
MPIKTKNNIGNASLADSLRANPLRIGISTRALFDLEEEHRLFEDQGVKAYAAMQLDREDVILRKGAGFEVVERLLALNDPGTLPYVEVILLSQNSPDLSLRAFKSINHYGLSVKTGSFTSGRSLSPFVPAWGIDLFLSNMDADVKGAVAGGAAAARLGLAPRIVRKHQLARFESRSMETRWCLMPSLTSFTKNRASTPSFPTKLRTQAIQWHVVRSATFFINCRLYAGSSSTRECQQSSDSACNGSERACA